MRLSLVGLNLLALAALMGAGWLLLTSVESFTPLPDMGRKILFGMFGAGALACLIAVAQFSRKRRMHAWGAITPMVIGFFLLGAGFAVLVAYAVLPQ